MTVAKLPEPAVHELPTEIRHIGYDECVRGDKEASGLR